jgi:hypothetical protein
VATEYDQAVESFLPKGVWDSLTDEVKRDRYLIVLERREPSVAVRMIPAAAVAPPAHTDRPAQKARQ